MQAVPRRPSWRSLLLAAAWLLAGIVYAPPARAQDPAGGSTPPALRVTADPRDHHAVIRIGPVLAGNELRDAALAGLPIRLRVRTELWHDGFFDGLKRTVTWSTVLVYEPIRRRFYVRGWGTTGAARVFDSYERARAAIEGEVPIRLQPDEPGRYYYTSVLEIETLSVSDLQELERWLQGELQPAVEGDQSIPGAIGQGAKRLLIRVLGVPNRRVETRSPRFHVE
jgi:hypothetical protein